MLLIFLKRIFSFLVELGPIRFAPDLETKMTMADKFLNTWLPTWLANAEKYLQARGGEWYATSGLTYADIAMMVRIAVI
jgi:Glutathione S-transferase, C-terminal domain